MTNNNNVTQSRQIRRSLYHAHRHRARRPIVFDRFGLVPLDPRARTTDTNYGDLQEFCAPYRHHDAPNGTNGAIYSFVAVIGFTAAQMRGEIMEEAREQRGQGTGGTP
ncbi:16159_t:CDS:2, partial [Acaulospora colombiana]